MLNSNAVDTDPNDQIASGIAEIRTYLNYSRAWGMRVPFGNSPLHVQSKLPRFQKLQPSKGYDVDEVKRHLTRGKLTLDLIGRILVNENPDFARVSALWLPVQTYYAVNGFGLALLAARKGPDALPKTHRAFLSEAASNFLQSHFPKPYSAMLKGGYKNFKHLQPEYVNIRDVRVPIRSGFNLESPDPISGDDHIVQCLNTTRRKEIDRRLGEVRKKRAQTREKISSVEW